MECVFCKIVSGQFNSFKIYEDDLFLAFLDINPTSTGEVLVVTKSHFESMFDMPDDLLGNVYGVIKKLSVDISEKLNASSIQLIQNNGKIQEVKHFHVHIVPHYDEEINLTLDEVFDKLKSPTL